MADESYWGNPQSPSSGSGASGSYWQGTYRHGQQAPSKPPEPPTPSPERHMVERYGSVSARARRAYAAEALRKKDHISAGLLAIFLGVFGIHKFYLGCNQAAFIMLAVSIIGGIMTFGLAAAVIWVIAAIEGIIYLSKSQTEFDRIYVLNQRDWF